MPAPDYKPPEGPHPDLAVLRAMMNPHSNQHELAGQIAALREEIAALRADLAPVPSLILTGREALDEFKRLKGKP